MLLQKNIVLRGVIAMVLPVIHIEDMSDDCLGSTDFFNDDALDMLQSPMVVEETKLR